MQGRIIRIISNQYTIDTGTEEILAVPRGKMRRQDKPVVGDRVLFSKVEDTYRLDSVEPRDNRLLRPAVANVDQALIVTSCKDPDFSEHLLNRLIFLVSMGKTEPVICITKWDLLTPNEQNALQTVLDSYAADGYTIVKTYPGSEDEELRAVLKDKVSVLCGQSGAGKSSLLNRLEPSFTLQTQEISKALGRGKHTTRHCQLHPVAGGLVADTPGFSSLDFSRMNVDELKEVILDFAPYAGQCRFSDCNHIHEPDCAIKQAVEEGKICRSIYEDYKQIMEEVKHL